MEKYMQVFSNSLEALTRIPDNPEFMMWSDTKNKKGWVVIKDTPENISLFDDKFGHLDIPEGYKVYYNEPYYYDLIADGVDTRHKIEEEKERQERLENPRIWKEVRGIESKDELLDYLLEYWYYANSGNVYEYSEDFEIDNKELELTYSALKNMKKSL